MFASISLLLSCATAPQGADTAGAVTADVDGPPMEALFSFAVLADPHITSDLERQDRLAAAVEWINASADAEQIELVFIVGDIGWDEGLPIARALLDELEMPYLPVIGDNEIHFGDEENFDAVFYDHYEALAGELEGWERGPVGTYNPDYDQTSWFQNFAFDYKGLRLVGLDWCSRDSNDLLSEFADLHDFEGGSMPFLRGEIGGLEAGPDENVLLFSHHPMHLGAFDDAEMEALTGLLGPVGERVAGAWAGHLHLNAEVEVPEAGYTAWVTDAVWDDENTVRVVSVEGNGERFAYSQELVILP
jgi:hypothetical protein